MITFAYPIILYLGLPIIFCLAYWHWYYYKKTIYIFSSLTPINKLHHLTNIDVDKLILLTRALVLISLCIAISRPRKIDEKSKVIAQGIDIMLVLDISGSMQLFDDLKDTRQRIEVAKSEAIKFIKKRENDAIGLVIFANGAVSRCPLTTDKQMLSEIIEQTQIGTINPEGTTLARALLAAINRLKNSTAKSKIIILLTDGEPTENDVDPKLSINLANKFGIKIYTIAVGSTKRSFFNHPIAGIVPVNCVVNTVLLNNISSATNGEFFHAQNPEQLEKIYSIIDKLEKNDQKLPINAAYCEYFMVFLWLALILLAIEMALTFKWSGI